MARKNPKNRTERVSVDTLIELYESRKAAIRARLEDFGKISEDQYLEELLYCLMTPQSSAEHAEKVVERLRQSNFAQAGFDPEPLLRNPEHYIRFHKTKARRLLQARQSFRKIKEALANGHSPEERREWLVKNVKGLGYKEATHFLRNIGKNGGLAILDRHIMRNLRRFGVLRSVPAALTRKRYFSIERRFKRFSETIGIPVDELDLLFWSMETGEIRK